MTERTDHTFRPVDPDEAEELLLTPRVSKEDKGLAVLGAITDSGRATIYEIMGETGMKYEACHQGIGWLRDFDPGCLVGVWEGRDFYYSLADEATKVRDYQLIRYQGIQTMVKRLEKQVLNAYAEFPADRKVLKNIKRDTKRLREEIEELLS
jgi:hypothetical protein